MIKSTKDRRQRIRFTGVFQYHENSLKDVDEARSYIIEMIAKCLLSRQPIRQTDFNLALYYGSYGGDRWTKNVNSSLRALVWKHSELTGKYCGCQYWSVRAKTLFDSELTKLTSFGKVTLQDAWELTNRLAENSNHPEKRLVHEHVFPIKHLVQELQSHGDSPTTEWVQENVVQKAIGCVLTEWEHCLLPESIGQINNPWLRYKGRIELTDNEKWPSFHRNLIMDAELL